MFGTDDRPFVLPTVGTDTVRWGAAAGVGGDPWLPDRGTGDVNFGRGPLFGAVGDGAVGQRARRARGAERRGGRLWRHLPLAGDYQGPLSFTLFFFSFLLSLFLAFFFSSLSLSCRSSSSSSHPLSIYLSIYLSLSPGLKYLSIFLSLSTYLPTYPCKSHNTHALSHPPALSPPLSTPASARRQGASDQVGGGGRSVRQSGHPAPCVGVVGASPEASGGAGSRRMERRGCTRRAAQEGGRGGGC